MEWRAPGSRIFAFAMQSRPSGRWRKKVDDRRCGTEIEAAVWPPVFGQTRSIEFVLGALSSVKTGPSRHANDRHPQRPWTQAYAARPVQGLPLMLAAEPLPIGEAVSPWPFGSLSCVTVFRLIGEQTDIHTAFHSTNEAIRARRRTRQHGLHRFSELPIAGVVTRVPSVGHRRAGVDGAVWRG